MSISYCRAVLNIRNRLCASYIPASIFHSGHNSDYRGYRCSSNFVSTNFYKKGTKTFSSAALILALGGAFGLYMFKQQKNAYTLKQVDEDAKKGHKIVRKDLPTFSMADVEKHKTMEDGVWVTYGIGVYDITKFIPEHPGSEKIMLGAGSSIDPFWHIYQLHNSPEILELLETFRIGNLNAEDDVGTKDLFDPWSREPRRHAALSPRSMKPFNAEPPAALLVDHFLTPNDLFYVRNHLPVPDIATDEYELEIEIEGADEKAKTLSLTDLQGLPKHHVTATVMCGGNRRSEMTTVKEVKGLTWGSAAVGNALWSGPKLCDILAEMDIKSDENKHVHFEGYDMDPTSTHYAASIPLYKAMDPRGDVILAYEMNGKPLPRDHGFPVRVICPGIVGARNVKWLSKITISNAESDSHWQQNDYKGFSPSTGWETVDFAKSPAIQNMPVTSAICIPGQNETVSRNDNGCVTVKGYAWSGGGNKIVRVDLTADQGKTWHVATLQHNTDGEADESNMSGRNWSWALWSAELPVSKEAQNIEIWSKAVDSNYNVQPESFENIWNLRGVLSNAYSRVQVKIM